MLEFKFNPTKPVKQGRCHLKTIVKNAEFRAMFLRAEWHMHQIKL
jgi:hypothetical protein